MSIIYLNIHLSLLLLFVLPLSVWMSSILKLVSFFSCLSFLEHFLAFEMLEQKLKHAIRHGSHNRVRNLMSSSSISFFIHTDVFKSAFNAFFNCCNCLPSGFVENQPCGDFSWWKEKYLQIGIFITDISREWDNKRFGSSINSKVFRWDVTWNRSSESNSSFFRSCIDFFGEELSHCHSG